MITIGDVVDFLGATADFSELVVGGRNFELTAASSLASATPGSVTFLVARITDASSLVRNTSAYFLIADNSVFLDAADLARSEIKAIVRVDNARLAFIRVVSRFFSPGPLKGIHPMASVSKNASLGVAVSIGANCYVGDKVIIGDNVVLHPGVIIYGPCVIGKNVVIHAGSVIGADGFGYERNEFGEFEKFPHIGGVLIGDNVEIGANACVDRGTLGDTVIMEGAKIDNLVHVAHNVKVGKHTAVIAQSMIGGSTIIGDYSWVAPSSCIRDQVRIGNHATVGLGSVVTRDVVDRAVVYGVPAKAKS